MKCPLDKSDLVSLNYEESVMVDACPICNGVWLDRGELEKIEETFERDHSGELSRIPDYVGRAYEEARQKKRGELLCPVCQVRMEAAEYAYCSQIMIDRCPECGGVWLDRGEVDAIEVFFERSKSARRGIVKGFLRGLGGGRTGTGH